MKRRMYVFALSAILVWAPMMALGFANGHGKGWVVVPKALWWV